MWLCTQVLTDRVLPCDAQRAAGSAPCRTVPAGGGGRTWDPPLGTPVSPLRARGTA